MNKQKGDKEQENEWKSGANNGRQKEMRKRSSLFE